MYNLDRTGTYLKYFGRKQDTVYIKNLLISIKLRWKKLVRRAGEKGRILQKAYKEDKRVRITLAMFIMRPFGKSYWNEPQTDMLENDAS